MKDPLGRHRQAYDEEKVSKGCSKGIREKFLSSDRARYHLYYDYYWVGFRIVRNR